MHVVILGSGVVGTTSAYYLSQLGHTVTVLERQAAPALETSFANAGQVSPGYSAPWAAPGVPVKAIKWMLSEYAPLVVRPQWDMDFVRFIVSMLRNCTTARYEVNKARMLRLAEYSRVALAELRDATHIQYDQRTQGNTQIFRTEKQLAAAQKDIVVLEQCNVPYELLDVAGCVVAEPALDLVKDKIVGALRLPLDETGDCFQFTQRLAELASKNGVEFRYGVNIQALQQERGKIVGIQTEQGVVQGDAYVMAMGSYSTAMLRPVGIEIPVYPVKGYSITLPVTDDLKAPQSTVMDETYKVAVTRLGNRIRAAGTAELTGFDLTLSESRVRTIKHVVQDLFPQGGNLQQAEAWTGLRPMTPDGTPLVSATKFDNLYLNTGHGTLGWTMACGSGRLLADMINKSKTALTTDGYALTRYSSASHASPLTISQA